MRQFFSTILALATVVLLFGGANRAKADLLFDNSGLATSDTASISSGYGAVTNIQVTTKTLVTDFSVETRFFSNSTAQYFIADHSTHQILFSSSIISYGVDTSLTFKDVGSSLGSGFLLQAGGNYDIGVVASGGSYQLGNADTGFSQNGITSAATSNIYTYGNISYGGPISPADPFIRISGTQSFSAPEPSGLAMLGTGVVGVIGLVRRRRKTANARVAGNEPVPA